jgi:para-aminobenzoate synthetase / 4-amino-4-deoxychorismate lyase
MTGAEAAGLAAATTEAVVALLDDSRAGGAGSRLYTGYSHAHHCTDPATLDACWAAVAADQQRGLHAVLLADYEWGAKLIGAGRARLAKDDASALRVLMFRELQRLDAAGVAAWLQAQDGDAPQPTPAGALDLQASVSEAEFTQAIDAVQEAIRNGETYQINYTYRLSGLAHGHPAALFRRLRARQPVAYGAYIVLPAPAEPDGITHVLSLSPELFLRHAAGVLTAQPMKGTASRLSVPESDSEAARLLQQDIKNRAENLMIVDLLRNDLGRVARIGSVRVPALFSVEPYATVFQMTSTVQAELAPGTHMPALLRALYPCGSITGAPKHHTMDLIAGLESTPRGLYCGAIGWVDAPQAGSAYSSVGDFCLSVAIRTLTLRAPVQAAGGARPLRLGIGAGIVQDSVAADEYQECRLKARFLTGLDPGFELFETLCVAGAGESGGPPQAALAEHHWARLARSAQALGWPLARARWETALRQALGEIAAATAAGGAAGAGRTTAGHWRLRLALQSTGEIRSSWAALAPLHTDAQGRLALWLHPVRLPDHPSPLAAHKTSHRALYDTAIREAEAHGVFDQLFATQDGRLVEGGRCNVLVLQGAQWLTPRLIDGALPGVQRGRLLATGWEGRPVREACVTLQDLARAERLVVANALRGAMPAVLRPRPDEAEERALPG